MKKINNLIIIIVSIISIVLILTEPFKLDRFMQLLFIIPSMLLIKIIRKTFKLKLSDEVELLYLVFIFGCYFLGIVLKFYSKVPYFDKAMHFLSGFITSFLALIILKLLKSYDKKKVVFNIIFIIFTALSVAALWEFFEYTCDIVLDRDAQNVLTTGVDDTMQDMILAFIASIIFSVSYLIEVVKGKKGLITNSI